MSAPLPRWEHVRNRISEFPSCVRESYSKFSCLQCLKSVRASNKMIVVVVFVAIYIDNMLTTTVVPIVPTYLFSQEYPEMFKRINGDNDDPGIQEVCREMTYNSSLQTTTGLEGIGQLGNITYGENCTQEEIPASEMRRRAEEKLNEQNTRVGLLFASKSAIQLIANPLVGTLTNMVGYSIPMFGGFCIIFISTLVFAYGKNYWVLLIARSVQGIGSSCSSVSGMGLIADRYQDDGERGNAMGIALSGLALGVLIGPPFGGIISEYLDKSVPFIILAAMAVMDGALQLFVIKPGVTPEQQKGTSIRDLLKDPYILLCSGAITFANMGIGMLEPTLPLFMLGRMHSRKLEQGIAFLPASMSYLVGTCIFGPMALKMGRWRAAMIGMVFIALSLFVIPFSRTIWHLVAPNTVLGFAIGMVDASMMPTMGYLVDLRHVSIYGNVYAIADIAFCLGFALGPAVGGVIVSAIGFRWMLWIISLANLLYAPLLYFLKDPPGNKEKVQLVMSDKCPIKYVTYRQSSYEDRRHDAEEGSSMIKAEPLEIEINEYTGDGEVRTRLARVTRQVVSTRSSISSYSESCDDEVNNSDDSGETEGADSEVSSPETEGADSEVSSPVMENEE